MVTGYEAGRAAAQVKLGYFHPNVWHPEEGWTRGRFHVIQRILQKHPEYAGALPTTGSRIQHFAAIDPENLAARAAMDSPYLGAVDRATGITDAFNIAANRAAVSAGDLLPEGPYVWPVHAGKNLLGTYAGDTHAFTPRRMRDLEQAARAKKLDPRTYLLEGDPHAAVATLRGRTESGFSGYDLDALQRAVGPIRTALTNKQHPGHGEAVRALDWIRSNARTPRDRVEGLADLAQELSKSKKK